MSYSHISARVSQNSSRVYPNLRNWNPEQAHKLFRNISTTHVRAGFRGTVGFDLLSFFPFLFLNSVFTPRIKNFCLTGSAFYEEEEEEADLYISSSSLSHWKAYRRHRESCRGWAPFSKSQSAQRRPASITRNERHGPEFLTLQKFW